MNAAARLVTFNPQDPSDTTALTNSTLLTQEIDSEQLSTIYKALNGQVPTYNFDVIAPYVSSQMPYFAEKILVRFYICAQIQC